MSARIPRLYPIIDADVASSSRWSVADLARAFVDGGATLLQLRAKHATRREWMRLTDAVMAITRPGGVRLLINDRVDIALATGADGVHIGQDDLPPSNARKLLGEGAVIGWSTHTCELVTQGLVEPVSYLAVGPVYQTGTKQTEYGDVGLERVRLARAILDDRVCGTASARMPLVAIGGINLERAADVIAAGADSVAVISDLLSTGDPAARVRAFLARLA